MSLSNFSCSVGIFFFALKLILEDSALSSLLVGDTGFEPTSESAASEAASFIAYRSFAILSRNSLVLVS